MQGAPAYPGERRQRIRDGLTQWTHSAHGLLKLLKLSLCSVHDVPGRLSALTEALVFRRAQSRPEV